MSSHKGSRSPTRSDTNDDPADRSLTNGNEPSSTQKTSPPPSRRRRDSYSRSPSRSYSRSRSRTSDRAAPVKRRSYSRSPSPRRYRKRSYSRSRSPSYRRRSRSRSYSRSPKRNRNYSRSRSPYSRRGYRSHSRSPMSNRRRHFGDRDNPEPSKCVGVFGLSLRTTERDLYDVFARYGDIDDVQLIYDKHSGRSRGFAFIYFKGTDDAHEAKERAHGMDIDGRNIRCDFSITKRAHTPTPGVYLGRAGGSRSPRSRRTRSRSRSASYDHISNMSTSAFQAV